MAEITTLLLVDGDAGAMRGLRMRLALESDLRVVGEARGHDDLAAIAGALAPAVVLVDIDPEATAVAIEIVRTLAAAHAVVVLSIRDDRPTAEAMRASGAAAFVGKHEGVARLLAAIRSSTSGAERAPPMA